MYPRFVERRAEEALADTPVVLIVGPRRAGKTTLARKMAEEGRTYITLDDRTVLDAALSDPNGFIRGLDPAGAARLSGAPPWALSDASVRLPCAGPRCATSQYRKNTTALFPGTKVSFAASSYSQAQVSRRVIYQNSHRLGASFSLEYCLSHKRFRQSPARRQAELSAGRPVVRPPVLTDPGLGEEAYLAAFLRDPRLRSLGLRRPLPAVARPRPGGERPTPSGGRAPGQARSRLGRGRRLPNGTRAMFGPHGNGRSIASQSSPLTWHLR